MSESLELELQLGPPPIWVLVIKLGLSGRTEFLITEPSFQPLPFYLTLSLRATAGEIAVVRV